MPFRASAPKKQVTTETYLPSHAVNRMRHEGDVEKARRDYFERPNRNLQFLLQTRFGWMNEYLGGLKKVYELGAGAGLSKEFITNPNLKLTDVQSRPWIDECVDALNLPFSDGSLDALVCSHMIHHVASPVQFLEAASRKLKKGGVIVISEIYTSPLMRLILRVMRHEGWSYSVDVFDRSQTTNDPRDPWSANCAIPELLFKDPKRFEKEIPSLVVEHYELTECLLLPISGGVIAKSRTIILPLWALRWVGAFDRLLLRFFPKVFAMGMRVVLRRR